MHEASVLPHSTAHLPQIGSQDDVAAGKETEDNMRVIVSS